VTFNLDRLLEVLPYDHRPARQLLRSLLGAASYSLIPGACCDEAVLARVHAA
jgi:hypothetical protein